MPLLRTGYGKQPKDDDGELEWPDASDKEETKGVKKPPRPKREFSISSLVYKKRIAELRENGEDRNDLSVLYAIADMLHQLIPVAEENYQEFPFHTNAAAVNNYLSQLREVQNDIRALEDFGKRSELITNFVGTQLKKALQGLVSDSLILQKTAKSNPSRQEELFSDFQRTQAKRFKEIETVVGEHVGKLLQIRT